MTTVGFLGHQLECDNLRFQVAVRCSTYVAEVAQSETWGSTCTPCRLHFREMRFVAPFRPSSGCYDAIELRVPPQQSLRRKEYYMRYRQPAVYLRYDYRLVCSGGVPCMSAVQSAESAQQQNNPIAVSDILSAAAATLAPSSAASGAICS